MSDTNKKTSGVVSLQSIVADVLNDLNVYSKENWERHMRWVIRGFTHLNMFTLRTMETMIVTVSDIGAIALPSDYIDHVRIGELIGDKIYTMGHNQDLNFPRGSLCGEDTYTGFDNETSTGVQNLTYNVPLGYRWYGIPGGQVDTYYKVDTELRQIQLSSVPAGDVVLQYISSGVSINGETYIPRQAQETLIAWVHWQKSKWDGGPMNRSLMLKQDYTEAQNELRDFETIPTVQEILDIFYEGYSQTPTR